MKTAQGLRILIAVGVMTVLNLAPVHGQQPICTKNTPATGGVPDPDWAFSYSSWAEPYAIGAMRYFYTFTNNTQHNVPVRWEDANIVRVKTVPGLPVESDRVDASPTGLLKSTILVGVQRSRGEGL